MEQRLSAFPTSGLRHEGCVTVYWDKHQIPFIKAERDGDTAFALGLVHAHLRLGQMEAYRRIAQGRVAEMEGPFATDIDNELRILDFGRTAEEIEAGMPPSTRACLEPFVAGINHHLETAPELPYEFGALGLEREPWSIRGCSPSAASPGPMSIGWSGRTCWGCAAPRTGQRCGRG